MKTWLLFFVMLLFWQQALAQPLPPSPQIEHTPPESACCTRESFALDIHATYFQSPIDSAFVFYRFAEEGAFMVMKMKNYGNGDFSSRFAALEPGKMHYYFQAYSAGVQGRCPGCYAENQIFELEIVRPVILGQNYPNPARHITFIPLELKGSQEVEIQIFRPQGQIVQQIQAGSLPAGKHQIQVDTGSFSEGIYYYKSNVSQPGNRQKMIVSR